jgi:hypothetical protein
MSSKLIGILFATAFVALGSGTAQAQFDKAELKCRKLIAKGFLKSIRAADKTSFICHKNRHKGKVLPAVDCNDLGIAPGIPGEADPKGKFEKAQQKLIDTPGKKCIGLDDDLRSLFISCPEPCDTALALPNPMTDWDDVSRCLACVAGDVVSTKNTTILGAPDPDLMSGDDTKCAQAIGKGSFKYFSTILKSRNKCQDGVDKAGGSSLDATCQTSPDPDGTGKVAKLLGKSDAGIDNACGNANLTNVGSCSSVSVADLKTCVNLGADLADAGRWPAHYQLETSVCPIAVDQVVKGNVRADLTTSATNLASGWNGIGHNQDLVDGYTLSADLTCASSTTPCGDCTIDGVSASGPQYSAFARCTEDTTVECANPFGTDPVCPGAQDCGYYAGPPLPVNSSNVPVCIVVRLQNDLSGTINPADGSAEQNLDVNALVHLGIDLTKPCPRCDDDVTAQDGVKDGTCSGGAKDGDPCDVQGFNSTFAVGSGISLDCPPSADQNISGSGLQLTVPSTTGASELPFGTKCDFPLSALDCACAVCSGDGTLPCNSNVDCSNAGAGSCTSFGAGAKRQPNGCADLMCTDGQCQGGVGDDLVTYCDGQLRANGGGLLTCEFNADCEAVDVVCGDGSPGSCGQCTLVETRPCFNDPISATGTPDLQDPVYAATFCTPPTNNPGVNGASGLPGPSRTLIDSATTFRY